MRWMLRNSHSQRDAALTMAATAVAVVLVKVLVAGMVIGAIQFGPAPDAGVIAAILTPTLGAYVARRNRIGAGGQEEPKP